MNKVAEHNLTKIYYTIGELAEMFDVNTSLIRFWEKEFQVIAPKKNRKGNRLFTPKDIVNINKIYYLVRIKGFTLDGAKNAIKSKEELEGYKPIEENEASVIEKLELIKLKLLKLHSSSNL